FLHEQRASSLQKFHIFCKTTFATLSVNSRPREASARRPLHLRKQTSDCGPGMSVFANKRVCNAAIQGLFDHLVGAGEQRRRHLKAKRLGGGEIDDEIELGRLLHWDVARLRPAQNLVGIVGGAPEQVREVWY